MDAQSPIIPNINIPEFLIRTGPSNYLAKIESTTGNMFISGKLYENREIVTYIPANSFLIKDESGEVMAFLTSASHVDPLVEWVPPWVVPAGSLILDGRVVTSTLPF